MSRSTRTAPFIVSVLAAKAGTSGESVHSPSNRRKLAAVDAGERRHQRPDSDSCRSRLRETIEPHLRGGIGTVRRAGTDPAPALLQDLGQERLVGGVVDQQ